LQAIDETGSIAAAGRRMGISYKRARYLIDTMNAYFSEPVVVSTKGGNSGGGGATDDTLWMILGAALVSLTLRRSGSSPTSEIGSATIQRSPFAQRSRLWPRFLVRCGGINQRLILDVLKRELVDASHRVQFLQ
jgi:molybdate transport repressor ModE-like protein